MNLLVLKHGEEKLHLLLTQFGVPGNSIAKIAGRIPAVVKMKKAADAVKGGKARKVSQSSIKNG